MVHSHKGGISFFIITSAFQLLLPIQARIAVFSFFSLSALHLAPRLIDRNYFVIFSKDASTRLCLAKFSQWLSNFSVGTYFKFFFWYFIKFLTADSLHKYFVSSLRVINVAFLAPTGAQGVTMSVCPAPYAPDQSRAVNLHLSRSESNQRALRALRKQSENTLRAIIEQSRAVRLFCTSECQAQGKVFCL